MSADSDDDEPVVVRDNEDMARKSYVDNATNPPVEDLDVGGDTSPPRPGDVSECNQEKQSYLAGHNKALADMKRVCLNDDCSSIQSQP